MPKYEVLVTCDATAHTIVTVEAKSVKEAEKLAIKDIYENGAEWTLDDNERNPYICDPGNCAEEIA